MTRRVPSLLLLGLCLFSLLPSWAQTAGRAKPRAKPPKFDKEETARVFFDDVFAQLNGTRPDLQTAPGVAESSAAPEAATQSTAGTSGASGWSAVISSTAIENEIKAIKARLEEDVTTPADFKGRGYEQCRVHFSVAAALFAIINEYDGDVRWKSDAPAARDVFARTGYNAKVGTAQVFNEAKQRKLELDDLLNGNGFAGDKPSEQANDWSGISDRAPIMKRLESGFENVVRTGTANSGDFKAKKDALQHEAELIAAFATVLTKAGMEDGDDESYQEFANQMRDAALKIVEATKQDNYEQAREASGIIDQTCTNCHDNFR